MKICFLINNYSFVGGAERVSCLLINEMSKKHKVDLVSLYDTSNTNPYDYNFEINVTVLCKNKSKNYFLDTLPCMKKLRNIIKNNKYDYLIYVGELLSHYAIFACRGTNTKCVCWTHTPALNYDESFLQIPLKRLMCKYNDFVITLTEESVRLYKKKYHINKVYSIPNPIDPILLNNSEYNYSSNKILSVGRICPQKNYELLIKVANKALVDLPSWTWDVYGDGDINLKNKLNKMIKDNSLDGRLNLCGVKNNIYDLYNQYSFIVLTSKYEGFPMVLLEAMSKGLPMISFNISTGPKEIIINNKNGYLIRPFDIKEMANKIVFLANNIEERINMSNYNRTLRDDYDIEVIANKWNVLLNEQLKD